MAVELKMPALSPTMEKGNLARWLVGVGDLVKPGDLLAEIETDKATMEFEAIDEGRVAELLVADGSENVAVGTVIARLVEAGEAVVSSAPVAAVAAPVEAPAPAAITPVEAAKPAPIAVAVASGQSSGESTANATPLARRIADAMQIDLATIKGSGTRGKVIKADLGLVPQAIASPAPATSAPALAASLPLAIHAPPAGVPMETVKLSGMRKTIARR